MELERSGGRRVSSDRSSKLLTDKAQREGGMQRRETGREKALMEVGGKLSVEEEEYEERSGLESGLVGKKRIQERGGRKKIVEDDCGDPEVYRNCPFEMRGGEGKGEAAVWIMQAIFLQA